MLLKNFNALPARADAGLVLRPTVRRTPLFCRRRSRELVSPPCPLLGILSKTTTWCNDQQIPPKLSAANAREARKLARQHPIWPRVERDICLSRLAVRRASITRIGVDVKGERTALHLTSPTLRAFSTIQWSTLWVKDTLVEHELGSSPLKSDSLHADHSQR